MVLKTHTEQVENLLKLLECRTDVVFRALARPVRVVHVFQQEVIHRIDRIERSEQRHEVTHFAGITVCGYFGAQNINLIIRALSVLVQDHVANVYGAADVQQLVGISYCLENARNPLTIVRELVQNGTELHDIVPVATHQKLSQIDSLKADIWNVLRAFASQLDEVFVEIDAEELNMWKHSSERDCHRSVSATSIEKGFRGRGNEVSHSQLLLQRLRHPFEIALDVGKRGEAAVRWSDDKGFGHGMNFLYGW